MENSNQGKNDLYQFVTDQVIKALENGLSGSFKFPWDNMSQVATNAVTGRRLVGISQLLCHLSMVENGFNVNRWLTFNAARKLGGKVISGAKSTKLCWLRPFVVIKLKNGNEKVVSPSGETLSKAIKDGKVFWAYRYANYFNVAQVSGLKDSFYLPLNMPKSEFSPIDQAESFIDSLINSKDPLKLVHKGNEAYYSPKQDLVVLPEKSLFYEEIGYYSTVFHEIGHWSGAKKRQNRLGIVNEIKFGSDVYAFEELIAELVAAFKSADMGLNRTISDDHVHYIEHWLKVLKKDNKAIFKASQEAMKAVNYLNALCEPSVQDSVSDLNVEVA